jgi:type IV secretion system protein VirB2
MHLAVIRSTDLQRAVAAVLVAWAPIPALAQSSPFMTGATALQTNILAWLTPIAIILVMALGAMAMANRMSWGWCLGAILGIAIAFGAPQIVAWVRGMFGV